MATTQTVTIKGKAATLFRDGEHPVYLLPDGRFAVCWNGDWRFRTTLRMIDKLTCTNRPSVKLIEVHAGQVFHNCVPRVLDVSAMEENRIIDKEGKRQYPGWGSWYLFDQNLADRLNDLEQRRAAAEQAFNDEFAQVMKGARPVGRYNLAEAIAGTLEPEEEEEQEE